MSKKKLFLLDVFPILYRAHFAMINQSLVNAAGINTAPILGFCNYLFQIIFKEQPSHIAAAFDSYSLERKTTMSDYKANREKAPEDIMSSVGYVKALIDALNIPKIEAEGFEADDVIGTLAIEAAQEGFEVFMVTPDKDFAQLVSEHIFLYKPPYKGVNFDVLDIKKVEEKYGVPPEQIADLLALKGDPVDNIPGVPKIGEKTAIELLKKFGSVEMLLERKEEVEKTLFGKV
jgi:DNA polymerase-1